MKKALPCLFFLLAATLFGCNPPVDPTSSDDDFTDYNFCDDDGEYFVFEKSDALKHVIDEFPVGALDNDDFELLLESLKLNDGRANKIEISLERKVDYGVLDVFDNTKDKQETYNKEVYRHIDHKMLIGTYTESIEAHGEALSTRSADYQSYRNGFCPTIARYFDVYDFGNILDDYAKEYIYSTEDFIDKLKLVDGGLLEKDLSDKKTLFEDSGQFDVLTFGATKGSSETKIQLIGEYEPVGEALGERVEYEVVIKNGMITKVRNFKGTYEVDGSTKVFRTSDLLVKELSAVTVLTQFDDVIIEIDEDFEGKRPLIDYIDIFL